MRLLWFNLATDADDPLLGFAIRWLEAAARRAEAIAVVTMRAGTVQVPGNVRVYSVGKERGYGEPRRVVEFYRHLLGILGREHIDACFSHMIPEFSILASPVMKVEGIPLVTWYAHRHVSPIVKIAHLISDRIVTSAEMSYRYRRDKVTVLGQGIDTELFAPDGTLPETSTVLSVGRLSPIKDQGTLIEAVALLRRRGLAAKLVLVGDAPERDLPYAESLRRKVADLGLADAVRFAGAVPTAETVSWYRRCTVHVNLSPAGAPDKTALEAMACGRPSLACNEAFRETMGEYADLLLFEQGNPESLARRLEAVLGLSLAERARIGSYLRRRVEERHGLERLMDRLFAVFGALIRGGEGAE